MSIPVLVPHTPHCTRKGRGHSDAAKRVADSINLHWAVVAESPAKWPEVIGKWCAFQLANGTGGMTLYDTKRDAVRHQSNEFQAMYVKIVPGGMNTCEAEILLATHRRMYDNGFRLADPDSRYGGPDLITRAAAEHRAQTLRMLQQ